MSPKTAQAVFDASYRRLSFPNVQGFADVPGSRFGQSPVSPTAYASMGPSGHPNRFSVFSDASSEEWHQSRSTRTSVSSEWTLSRPSSEMPTVDTESDAANPKPKLGRSSSMPDDKRKAPQMRRGNTAEAGTFGDVGRPASKRFPLVQIDDSQDGEAQSLKMETSRQPGVSGFYGRRRSNSPEMTAPTPPGLKPYRQTDDGAARPMGFGSSPDEPWGAKSKAGALLRLDSGTVSFDDVGEDVHPLPIASGSPTTSPAVVFPPTPHAEEEGRVSPTRMSWPNSKLEADRAAAPAKEQLGV